MLPLRVKSADPFDLKQVLKSKYFQKIVEQPQELKELNISEINDIKMEQLIYILTNFNKSIDQKNLEMLVHSLLQFYQLIDNQKSISQEIVNAIKSNFLGNINLCISTIFDSDILSFIILILSILEYLSNDLIEEMFNNNTLNILMEIFVEQNNNISKNYLFNLFGNACSINRISAFYQNILFDKIKQYILCDSIFTRKNCLYCLLVLTTYFPIPVPYINEYLMSFKNVIQKSASIFQLLRRLKGNDNENEFEDEDENENYFESENENNDKNESEDENENNNSNENNDENDFNCDYDYDFSSDDVNKELNQIISNDGINLDDHDSIENLYRCILEYVIIIIDKHSSNQETCYYIVNEKIPCFLLSVILLFPIDIQPKLLKIVQNSLNVIPTQEIVAFSQMLDVKILLDLIGTSDNLLISMVYDIFYKIGFYHPFYFVSFLTKNMLINTIQLIDTVDFDAKVSILNFLTVVILNDKQNVFADILVTDLIVDEFTEIAELGNIVKGSIGVITKLYTLTYDNPDLHSILEPFVIDSSL